MQTNILLIGACHQTLISSYKYILSVPSVTRKKAIKSTAGFCLGALQCPLLEQLNSCTKEDLAASGWTQQQFCMVHSPHSTTNKVVGAISTP